MIVVDASAVLEVLMRTPAGERLSKRLHESAETLHAPHLLDLEIAQVVRRYCVAGKVTPARGRQAITALLDLPLQRYPHAPLLPRIWELRHAITAYDAAYVALAEELDAPLVTSDAKLAKAHGHRARIELVGG